MGSRVSILFWGTVQDKSYDKSIICKDTSIRVI